MSKAARGLIEQLLMLSAQFARAKLRRRADVEVLWHARGEAR
jgi:hypothetical protein